jgi:hypothetical protein
MFRVATGQLFQSGVKSIMKPTARKDNLRIKRDTGELFIEDLVTAKFIHLNPTSAYVWEKCDGQKEPNQIAQEMGAELGVSVSEKVVSMALNKLSSEQLLVA